MCCEWHHSQRSYANSFRFSHTHKIEYIPHKLTNKFTLSLSSCHFLFRFLLFLLFLTKAENLWFPNDLNLPLFRNALIGPSKTRVDQWINFIYLGLKLIGQCRLLVRNVNKLFAKQMFFRVWKKFEDYLKQNASFAQKKLWRQW